MGAFSLFAFWGEILYSFGREGENIKIVLTLWAQRRKRYW